MRTSISLSYFSKSCISFLKLGQISEKKGTFVKYLIDGEYLEARQNSLYTYFYYKDELINTIKNKVNNDYQLIYNGIHYKKISNPDQNEFNSRKLGLYSAKWLPGSGEYILFSKLKDNGNSHFIYNINTGEWSNLDMYHKFSKIENTPYGFIFTGSNYKGLDIFSYLNNSNGKLYQGIFTTPTIEDFAFGEGDEVKIYYSEYDELKSSTKIYLNDYKY